MKRWIAMLLALMTAFALTACSKNTGEVENGKTPEEPSNQEEISGQSGAAEKEKGRPLYIFVDGQLVGSWEDGQWVSAVSEEGNHPFTLAEILAVDGYYVYQQVDMDWDTPRENYLIQCEFYTYNEGVSGFVDEARDTAAMLDPLAIFVPEDAWSCRTFALPTVLDGEAAELLVPNYSFELSFGGVTPELAVSQRIEAPEIFWQTEGELSDEYTALAEEALGSRGLTGAYQMETVVLEDGAVCLVINNDDTLPGYWDDGPGKGPEGGVYFNLVLYVTPEGSVETVYENVVSYDDHVTNTTHIFPKGIWDLNSDGQVEICLEDSRWEWGYNYVMARNEDGIWQRVLQANHGM